MQNIFGAIALFLMASVFIATSIIGIVQMEKDKNNPFAAIGFALQLPTLVLCVMFVLACSFLGFFILTH
ncbi:hypothetical protein JW977_03600 [Candidatus Falkowbacteria bacterium]|nr:hypothetical protein [Candidatus Falkowbacteria bacterium]